MNLNNRALSPGLFFPTREQFLQSCISQEFPFPMTLMKYIWMNPSSPKEYIKLIQCCKIFFIKNPILVFDYLLYDETENPTGWGYSIGEKEFQIGDTIRSDIWPTEVLWISSRDNKFVASSVIPKMVRYNVEDLSLQGQKLTYDELKFFASGVKMCMLNNNQITYDNGEAVPVENVLQLFSNGEEIDLEDRSNCESYVALADACQNIKIVSINVENEFDAVGFYQYLKKIKNRSLISIRLSLPSQGIDDIYDEILNADSFDFVPPLFTGSIEYERWKKIEEIQFEVFNSFT